MSRIKRITVTLFALRKSAHSAVFAKLIEPVLSAGQDLVRVGLMSHVPDDLVLRQIKGEMQRHRKLHNSQIRSQMTAVHTDLLNQKIAYLLRQLRQFFFLYLFYIVYFSYVF